MPLQKQLANLQFNGGLSQKTAAFNLQPNNMLVLKNARFIKSGQVNKRPGFATLPDQVTDGSNINQSVALNAFNDELILFDGTYVYSYLEGAEAWINRGVAISVINTSDQVIRTIAAQQLNPDGVNSGGLNVFTWEDSRGGVRYSAIDSITGARAVQDSLIYNYPPSLSQSLLRAKTIVDGNGNINIFYCDGGSTLLNNVIQPYRPTIISSTTRVFTDGLNSSIITNPVLPFVYDVVLCENQLVYAYNASNGSEISFVKLLLPSTSVIVLDLPNVGGNVGSLSCINLTVDSLNNIWISFAYYYLREYYVYSACYTLNGTQVMAATLIDTITNDDTTIENIAAIENSKNPGSIFIAYESNVTTDPDSYFQTVSVQLPANPSNTGTVTALYTQRQLGLASKCFTYNGNQYVNVASNSTLQSTYFTYCINLQTVVGKINSQIGGGYRTNNILSECMQSGLPGSFLLACGQKGRFQVDNNVSFSFIGVSSENINFEHNNSFNAGVFNNNLLFVGGFLQSYDGVSVSEQNFHFYPENCTATQAGTAGSLSTGFYQYQVTYEWTDNYGQTQYSAPSPAVSVTVEAGYSVNVVAPTLRVTEKQNPRSPVVVTFYRTQANLPIFYKIGSVNNDMTVDTITINDVLSDVAIGANLPLYTQQQVANGAPPSCSLITYYQNRIMVSGLEDTNTIWFSQKVFDFSEYNAVAPEFSPLLTIGVDAWKGDITALGWMDDKLLIFKDQTIYTMNGDGPTASGTGNPFPSATSLLTTVGSTNQNSLVVTYNGVFFKSSKGIYMVDRGLNPTYIGAAVEDFNGLTVTSAELLADTDEVVFCTAEGTLLVYNYYFNVWSTWDNLPSVDSCIWQDNLVLVNSQGTVFVQNDDELYSDNGNFYQFEVQTPWLAWAGMQGYQSVFRAFLLGNFIGSHLLNIAVNTDYNPSPIQNVTINSNIVSSANWGGLQLWGSGTAWGGEFVPYLFQINFNAAVVRNQAIQLTFSDSQSAPFTGAFTLNSLTFEVGVMTDGPRIPLTNKAG